MGHTVLSQRNVLDLMLAELRNYGKALNKEDREIYARLLKLPLKHYGAISYTDSINAWSFLLMSVILEQEKKIKTLEELYEGMANGYLSCKELNSYLD